MKDLIVNYLAAVITSADAWLGFLVLTGLVMPIITGLVVYVPSPVVTEAAGIIAAINAFAAAAYALYMILVKPVLVKSGWTF